MKNYLIPAGIAFLVAFAIVSFSPAQKTAEKVIAPSYGAISSPDMNSPYFSWGGVRNWAVSTGFLTASSTLCAMQSPSATTTLVSATVRFDTTIATGAGSYELGWGAVTGATTTVLARKVMTSGKQTGEVVATTSISGTPVLTDNVVAPSTWINFNIASGTVSSSFAPTGKCSVVFKEL